MNWEDPIVEAAATDTGMRRTNNQDSFAVVRATKPETWRERGHVFVVADGMGAHAVGELASKLACDNIPHAYNKTRHATPVEAVVKAYRDVGGLIHGKATANKDFHGMGTTCSTLILLPDGALIAHVGDSRVYRVREDRIDQLTFDHSLVWELVRHKHLNSEQALKSVPRNVITRSLGPDPVVEVDIEGPMAVQTGDVFVLCSDGLSGPVNDLEIGTFAAQFHPEHACRYLTHLANLRGGSDNITILVVRIGPWAEPGAEPEPAPAPAKATASGRGFLSSILSNLPRRSAKLPLAEEHRYRTSECPLQEPILLSLANDVRNAQAHAVEQSWPVDWSVLSNLRQEAEEARSEGDLRAALRCTGEAIAMLGLAGRIHRKDQGHNGSH